MALDHLREGRSIDEVSSITRYDSKSIKSWLELFILFDYEGLRERAGRGRKPRLPSVEEEDFKIELDNLQESRKGGRIVAFDVQGLLANKFDCCYSIFGIYALLDRLNIVWISGRSKHPKQSQEAIDQYKISFPEEVEKIKDKLNSKKIEVWWQDKSRRGQRGSLSRVWAAIRNKTQSCKTKTILIDLYFWSSLS